MSVPATDLWLESNHRQLVATLTVVGGHLDRHAGRPEPVDAGLAAQTQPDPPGLGMVCSAFGLTPFERDVLVLCAGVELDSAFAARCADAQDDPRRPYPTFGLALAALPDPHWSALAPAGPLRRWRLIDVGPGESLTQARLRIDERILHFLTGVHYLDERLVGLIEPVPAPRPEALPPSHLRVAGRVAGIWARAGTAIRPPLVQVIGRREAGGREIVAAACDRLGVRLQAMRAEDVPSTTQDRDALARLWEREAILSGSALVIELDGQEPHDRTAAAAVLAGTVGGLVAVVGPEPLPTPIRSSVRLDVPRLPPVEQAALWRSVLGEGASGPEVDEVVGQFDLFPPAIRAAAAETEARSAEEEGGRPSEGHALWEACRSQARPRLDDLAQRIEPAAGWEDLVLPERAVRLLRQITVHVRRRRTVYESWGFAARSSRGLGVSALFAGPSGTGKTMAGEVLARELRLDLYRIDLSQVVSKYIGETEKNLRQVFDAAEDGGAVLLFDEADALFGKRSEIKDSHDRYANIEVSYLLQRMEAYRGLAILTTNMKEALDQAFLRRIRFLVAFPFPDAALRAEIWRRVFPPETPVADLDVAKLARLGVAGGNIRNIALSAAFLAAEDGGPVGMGHVLEAARAECAKLDKPLTDAEIGGWV